MSTKFKSESDQQNEWVRERLRAHGILPTAQRVEIGLIILAEPQHLSAEQLLALVNGRNPVVSKATVYNTLGLFARRGLLREVIVDRTKVFFDSNTSEHYHFYDIESGNLIDIDKAQIAIGGLPALPEGTEVDGVDVIVRVRRRPRAAGPSEVSGH